MRFEITEHTDKHTGKHTDTMIYTDYKYSKKEIINILQKNIPEYQYKKCNNYKVYEKKQFLREYMANEFKLIRETCEIDNLQLKQ